MATGDNLGAFGGGGAFSGFEDADFDAYLENKQSSNAYTLERRRAKDHLVALCRAIESRLSDGLADLERGASEEQPSVANGRRVEAQWVYWTRPAEARKSLEPRLNRTDLKSAASLFDIAVQHQHACLASRLDRHGLAFNVELAGKAVVDRDNLEAKLGHEWALKKMVALVTALPEGTTVGPSGDAVAAGEVTLEVVKGWGPALEDRQRSFLFELAIPRDDDELRSDAFVQRGEQIVAALLPVLDFVSWSRDDDQIQLQGSLQKEKKEKKREVASTLGPGDRVTILSGLFAGRGAYVAEIGNKGKAKVMVGPVAVTVDLKDLKAS